MSRDFQIDSTGAEHDFGIDYESELNEQQLQAVRHHGGPMLVLAGAGSGKTRTITFRAAYLIEQGVDPDRILLATFTNKAANEMVNRVNRLTGGRADDIWGGTFHHLSNKILRRHATELDYTRQFTIMDAEDAKTLMDDAIADLDMEESHPDLPGTSVIHTIYSLSENTMSSVEEVVKDQFDYHLEHVKAFEQIIDEYRVRKQQQDVMDFDDLLVNLLRLFDEHEEYRDKYARKFRHILVDEFQDTNELQSQIVDRLSEHENNLMVVGDDAQSIYSFRGANFQNILRFDERYANASIYKLEINYRSTPEILSLANSSIENNEYQFPKELEARRDSGYLPTLLVPETESEQAEFIATHAQRLKREEDIAFSDQAVLYRSHHHSLTLQVELTQRGIPYYVRSGLRFFEQAHIKDVTSYLKAMLNASDELAWKRVMKLYSGIGAKTAAKLYTALSRMENPIEGMNAEVIDAKLNARNRSSWQDLTSTMQKLRDLEAEDAGAAAMFDNLLDDFYRQYLRDQYDNAPSRLEDIDQLANFADRQPDLESFLSEMALRSNLDSEQVDPDQPDSEDFLVLSTVHQAKGLEWDVVYSIWLTEGEFPHHRSVDDQEDVEEERRLFYVSATRARDELYMTYPLFSQRRKGDSFQNPSRFIQELDESTYQEAELERTSH
jgi:DNA helicase-2/ATP-dependent DNA helicase PcrA